MREVAARHERRAGRQDVEQRPKGALHVVEVAIDVGVIELDRREEQHRRR
jgi:hypothetical protein